jgi:hypothetical protein
MGHALAPAVQRAVPAAPADSPPPARRDALAAPAAIDIDDLVERTLQRLTRRLAVERERRGG